MIDEGEIRAAERTLALTEVELELKQGPVDQLLVWAERISKEIPIFLNLISKAEQGYWLAGMHELEPAVPESLPLHPAQGSAHCEMPGCQICGRA